MQRTGGDSGGQEFVGCPRRPARVLGVNLNEGLEFGLEKADPCKKVFDDVDRSELTRCNASSQIDSGGEAELGWRWRRRLGATV
jgi:hypothetical protein